MNAGGLIDRHGGAIRALLVLIPCLTGCVPVTGLLNPVWSSVFGFPLQLAVWADPHPVYADHPWTEMVAVLLWPPALLLALVLLSGRLMEWRHPLRLPLVLLCAASTLIVVPAEALMPTFADWPLFIPD